jgi:hypothetical protein
MIILELIQYYPKKKIMKLNFYNFLFGVVFRPKNSSNYFDSFWDHGPTATLRHLISYCPTLCLVVGACNIHWWSPVRRSRNHSWGVGPRSFWIWRSKRRTRPRWRTHGFLQSRRRHHLRRTRRTRGRVKQQRRFRRWTRRSGRRRGGYPSSTSESVWVPSWCISENCVESKHEWW